MGDEGACGESDRKRLTLGNVFVETRVPVCVLRGPNLGLPCSRRNGVGEICEVCVCLCVCVHIFMFVFARKCVCMHVCVCVCLLVYKVHKGSDHAWGTHWNPAHAGREGRALTSTAVGSPVHQCLCTWVWVFGSGVSLSGNFY